MGAKVPNLRLTVVDDDLSHGDYVTYSVQTGTGDEYYTTSGNQLQILRFIDLGINPDTIHTFDVLAVDSGGLTCTTAVNITVVNVNDQHYITNLPDEINVNAQTVGAGQVVRGAQWKNTIIHNFWGFLGRGSMIIIYSIFKF